MRRTKYSPKQIKKIMIAGMSVYLLLAFANIIQCILQKDLFAESPA